MEQQTAINRSSLPDSFDDTNTNAQVRPQYYKVPIFQNNLLFFHRIDFFSNYITLTIQYRILLIHLKSRFKARMFFSNCINPIAADTFLIFSKYFGDIADYNSSNNYLFINTMSL